MKAPVKLVRLLQRITSVLLLLTMALQIMVVLFLSADIDEFEIDEIHEVTGFVFLGLMFLHILLYWKGVKSLFTFKAI
jgi:cytochrome b561